MSDWKGVLAKVAPTLAAALGGPFAGIAANTICSVLTGRDVSDAGEDMIAGIVAQSDPNALLKLKKADNQFKKDMKELDIKDRDSARDLAKSTTITPQVVLSVIYTIGYFWLMYSLIQGDVTIQEDIMPLVMGLLGVMTAAQAQIMNFWFGSSSGSKEKTDALSNR